MANVKISELTAATTLAATDQFEINAAGTSKSATAQKVLDLAASATLTLTNKTLDTAGTGNSLKINGTAVSAVTGTGSVVLATSPTLVTPALGTPTALVLTSATGLPLTTGVTGTLPVGNGGTGATTLTGILKGNGTSAFTAVTAPSGTIVGTSDAQTLTSKRIDPRVSSTTSASSVTPDVSAYDQYCFTALAATLTINAPTGTPVDGTKLIFRILDNGTQRTLNWDATYTAIGVTRPGTTTVSKTTYVGCIYNSAATRWDVVAVVTQA